ncbi:MAG: hypothetical protein J6X83_07210 [Methanomicrobium sp.]|nr:hypothetical protein [Methanomicrobium sp.]
MSEISLPCYAALTGTALLIVSGILYLILGGSTGILLILIGLIIGVSSTRIKRKTINDLKDAGRTMVFFGLLTLLSFILFLSGDNFHNYEYAYYIGIAGSASTIIAGYLTYRSTKIPLVQTMSMKIKKLLRM